ncbi:MAG: hypothetical protein WC565_08535 [Parcubacteria group bacterium]|jgi:hypothetical protein
MQENQTRMAKYTPGPWEIERTAHRDLWIASPDGRHIVGTVSCGGDMREEGRANARLISLAPRMVDALRDALPVLEAEEYQTMIAGGMEVLPEAEEVRAILREIDEEES